MNENINIQLPKDYLPQLREFYNSRKAKLQNELHQIDALLSQLNGQPDENITSSFNGQELFSHKPATSQGGYNSKWSLIKKAKFAINAAGRPLTSKEIVDLIIDNYETELKSNRKRFMSSMSGTLSGKSKEGDVFKRKLNDEDDFEYDIA